MTLSRMVQRSQGGGVGAARSGGHERNRLRQCHRPTQTIQHGRPLALPCRNCRRCAERRQRAQLIASEGEQHRPKNQGNVGLFVKKVRFNIDRWHLCRLSMNIQLAQL